MILPVIFHNLEGYDAHLFIKQLARLTGDLSCIPSTDSKYISFSKKIKVDEYKSQRTGETVSVFFWKYDLLILTSFFKQVLPMLLEIYNQMIFTTQKP